MQMRRLLLTLFLVPSAAFAQDGPPQEVFLPARDKAPVVIVISGASGPVNYKLRASQVSKLGYYTVLIDGKDILTRQQDGAANLRATITKALAAKAREKPLELVVYPEADHSFDDHGGRAYRGGDAEDAWRRTQEMLSKHQPLK